MRHLARCFAPWISALSDRNVIPEPDPVPDRKLISYVSNTLDGKRRIEQSGFDSGSRAGLRKLSQLMSPSQKQMKLWPIFTMPSIFENNRTALVTGASSGIGLEIVTLVSGMVRRGHGAVLNIGSGAGHAAMPNAAVYTGCKHFIRAFSESLRAQLKGTGVIVCEAAPGPVKTDFDQIAGIGGEAIPGQSLLRITAAQCARDIVRGLERGTAVIYPGRTYRWLMRLQSLMPRRLIIWQIAKCARELRTRVRT
jgi:hypothetical protein